MNQSATQTADERQIAEAMAARAGVTQTGVSR